MSDKTIQILSLANSLGACSLNGKPARLELKPRRLPRVVAHDGSNSAAFNPSVVKLVVIEKGGRFFTRGF